MDITLSAEESDALQKALRSYATDLRMEIADTDNPGYRRDLRDERALLESVITKLDAGVRGSSVRDVGGRVVVRLVGVWTVD